MGTSDDRVEHLFYRIGCMYRKLGSTSPVSVDRFPPRSVSSKKFVAVHQDFRGGLSKGDIRQFLNGLVFEIAHVKDLLKNCLKSRGQQTNKVETYIEQDENLKIIVDLANVDKHGYPLRRFRSKHRPRLGECNRVLALRTGSAPGSSVCFTHDLKTGKPRVTATKGGGGEVVFTGDVLDGKDNRVGDIVDVARLAVIAWEKLFSDLGLGGSST